ncbi:MAG: dienelactone hydrolase family protein [Verrucomicrobiota bacterium]
MKFALLAIFFTLTTFSFAFSGMDDPATRVVSYELDGVQFQSTIVWDQDDNDRRPAVLMVPNWMGPTEQSLEKARMIADDDYVVMMVDLYGVGVRPTNMEEASSAAGFLRGDRSLMRARMAKALEVLLAEQGLPLKNGEVAAIGFCFGGGAVLEFARTGADLDAVVSFHGDLLSPTLEADSKDITASVLVLHGADDPFVPQSDVDEWVTVMLGTGVDWQLVQFSNTVHSFTDPSAAMKGQAEYNPLSAKRAYEYMEELFDEKF